MVATVRYAPPKLGDCCRCFTPTPATTTMDLAFGEEAYLFRLCENHADMLQTQMFGWTRVGEPLLPVQVHRHASVTAPAARRGVPTRIPVPEPVPVVEHAEDDEDMTWAEDVPENVRDLARSAPGVIDWRLSRTARARADEAGVDLLDVLLAAEAPAKTEPGKNDPDVSLHTRGAVTAIVNTQTKVVLTMFRREERISGHQAS